MNKEQLIFFNNTFKDIILYFDNFYEQLCYIIKIYNYLYKSNINLNDNILNNNIEIKYSIHNNMKTKFKNKIIKNYFKNKDYNYTYNYNLFKEYKDYNYTYTKYKTIYFTIYMIYTNIDTIYILYKINKNNIYVSLSKLMKYNFINKNNDLTIDKIKNNIFIKKYVYYNMIILKKNNITITNNNYNLNPINITKINKLYKYIIKKNKILIEKEYYTHKFKNRKYYDIYIDYYINNNYNCNELTVNIYKNKYKLYYKLNKQFYYQDTNIKLHLYLNNKLLYLIIN